MPPAFPHLALVRRPSSRLAEGEVTHVARQVVDVELARRQHTAYVQVLRQHGLEIVEVPPADEHPDGLFVEDTLVVLERGAAPRAVLTRPGADSRRGEIESVALVAQARGLALARITAPATLDGGDVLVTPRHVLVGQSTRSNAAALAQLAPLTGGRPVVPVPVHGALHLKTAVTSLPDGALIAVPAYVDCAALRALGYQVHEAADVSGGDVLCLGDTVLLPASAAATAAQLRALGHAVQLLDLGELQKLEAGVTCMSVLV
ncbi:MAG: N(G),N(G)-dimethylarginine dimethylaminohydrolase [Myxococcales bacterium]|nr:N(G),N(G)-dimethylarginine dimethylaminohydrolase [Myxococcales bacterium]